MGSLQRFHKLLTDDQIKKIENTTVLILGIGGVGSYAVESLARSGIKRLILIDYDVVDISNLNRQILALNSTIGLKKIDVAKQRILDINPNVEVVIDDTKILWSNIDLLFKYKFDYLIDACDTIATKQEIIKECTKRDIKFISSMATGNKFDPTKLEITDIRNTSYDTVAKLLRKLLKNENITKPIIVVSSKERRKITEGRTPGSTSFVPATAGLLCASYIINDVIDENKDLKIASQKFKEKGEKKGIKSSFKKEN